MSLEVQGVYKSFGPVKAVQGVSFTVPAGRVCGLLGSNGAGKTTTILMLLGLSEPSAGSARVAGLDPVRQPLEVKRRVGYLPDNAGFYGGLTGRANLRYTARLNGLRGAAVEERIETVLAQVGLADAADGRVETYSRGMRQRLGFAQALLGRPRILFLDEPTTGLDPEAIREFYAILRGLRAEGVTMVLTSHILAEIQERVDRLAIMAAGRIQATGTVQALREQMDLPLWFDIRLAPGDFDAVRAVLGRLPVSAIEARDGHIAVQCRREAKMTVLEALAALDGKVLDLHVREPSLEDVFFGFSD